MALAMRYVGTLFKLAVEHFIRDEALQGHVIALLVPDHAIERIARQTQSLLIALHCDFASETELLANRYLGIAAFTFASHSRTLRI